MKPHGKTLILTGGDGYIGSHLSRYLLQLGNQVITLDRDRSLKYGNPAEGIESHYIDLSTAKSVIEIVRILAKLPSDSIVVHLAAEKSVEESAKNPELYMFNNLETTRNILSAMGEVGLTRIVFASTAAVYAPRVGLDRVDENSELLAMNAYAESKIICESLIKSKEYGEFNFVNLRFFNVVGAESKSLIEKSGRNLIPEILRSLGNNSVFKIFGNDYPTYDGTCVRDFIDVRDLINAITLSFNLIESKPFGVINIGNGVGYSVLDVVKKIQQKAPQLRYEFTDRRVGDQAYVVADSSLAQKLLGWKPVRDLDAMIESVWT